jgi:hypothetical protein
MKVKHQFIVTPKFELLQFEGYLPSTESLMDVEQQPQEEEKNEIAGES